MWVQVMPLVRVLLYVIIQQIDGIGLSKPTDKLTGDFPNRTKIGVEEILRHCCSTRGSKFSVRATKHVIVDV